MPDPKPYILVVDDNKITTKLMRRYLEANGFEAVEAYDGVECLEQIEKRQPDAVMMDVMMPRLDGLETVSKIKSNPATQNIPVAIVTALNDVGTQVKAVEAGADDFLTKPIEEKLIITKARVLTSLAIEKRRSSNRGKIIEALLEGRANDVATDIEAEGFKVP